MLDIGSKLGIITIFVVVDVVWCSILSVYTDVSDYLRIKFNIPSSSDLLANVIESYKLHNFQRAAILLQYILKKYYLNENYVLL